MSQDRREARRADVDEAQVTEEQVHEEHLAQVNQNAHWAYLLGVLGVSFVLMVGLIALLGR